MKKLALLLLLLLLPSACGLAATGGPSGASNYIYSEWMETLPVPPAYTLERSVTAPAMDGVESLVGLSEAHVTADEIFILCQTRLIVTDHGLRVKRILDGYTDETGASVAFAGLTGLYVCDAGDYYLCQPEQGRILHFEADGTLRRVLGRPDITGFEEVNYRPTKIAVDGAGRLFVIAKGMYEGIVELQPDGDFSRFYGVNKVQFSITQLIWRTLATAEQRSRQQLWLPMDFTNLCLDPDGFIYATVQGEENRLIVRLNAKGENILRSADDDMYPRGDKWINSTGYGIPVGRSTFISVDVNEAGAYAVLDSKRGRVFTYNEDGRLLYVLGGFGGDREGYFRNPVDVDFVGDKLLVLDQLAQSLELFSPTDYGAALNRATYCQRHFDYPGAEAAWREALSYNHNLPLAYAGIGRALLRDRQYEAALSYLQEGGDREYYDKAFQKVRNARLREAFVPGVCGLAALVIVVKAAKACVRRTRARKGAEA